MGTRFRSWWQQIKRHPFIVTGIIVVVIALSAFAIAVIKFGWDWTGFNGGYGKISMTSTTKGTTTTTEQPLTKTLWDWLQLFFVPIVLVIGGFWLNQIQKSREQRTAHQQAELERELTRDNQEETLLQAYIDKMSELLLKEGLGESDPGTEVRKIARVRSLTILPRLDANRKRSVLQFLYESGLIDKDKHIVDLQGADLRRANLRELSLYNANLHGADLEQADLFDVKLREANLEQAILELTNMTGADLREANLQKAFLFSANLRLAAICAWLTCSKPTYLILT